MTVAGNAEEIKLFTLTLHVGGFFFYLQFLMSVTFLPQEAFYCIIISIFIHVHIKVMFTLIPQEIISFTYCIKKDFADAIVHKVFVEYKCL